MKTDNVQISDEKLLEMTKTGDMNAFETLVERYKKKAYYIALRLVGDPADAKDISQDAFIRIYRARKKYDSNKSFFSWFYTILSNLARNHLKKGKVRAQYKKSVQDEHQADKGDISVPSPDVLMEADQNKQLVWSAIEKLSFEHREIIVLRHFEDLSYEEIATAIGIPTGSVMSRLYYARLKLKEIIGEPGE
jgi:RNA polymerase sigma-70 factor, ECF subfamily